MMAESSNADADAARPDELLEFNQAFNANVSNFVTVKLSGKENYDIWHAQMMCLLEVCNMSGLLGYDHAWYSSKSAEILERYDNLLKGWVIGSIDKQVLKHVRHYWSALDIWDKLLKLYAAPNTNTLFDSPPIKDRMLIEVSLDESMKLLNAYTMKGSWWNAKAILKDHETAATMMINNDGDTMLHLAVREGKNYFVSQLLNFIKDESELKYMNRKGHTALHTAVIVRNKQAVELLVNKSNELLYVPNCAGHTPLDLAYTSDETSIFVYLLGVTRDMGPLHSNRYLNVPHLLAIATSTKQYNLALKLVEIPELLASATEDDKALMALTTDFPPELGFWEELIYP